MQLDNSHKRDLKLQIHSMGRHIVVHFMLWISYGGAVNGIAGSFHNHIIEVLRSNHVNPSVSTKA